MIINIIKIFKKIPFIRKEIKKLKPDYDDIILQLFNKNNDLTIIDVGANEGQSIDLFCKIFYQPEIYSFEPTPILFNILKEKYSKRSNIHLYSFALGNENGFKNFNISSYSPTNSFLTPNYELYESFNNQLLNTLKESKNIKVEIKKFDDWYKQTLNNRKIDIFKIDTQGFEYEVICGAIETLKSYTKMIIFEIQFLPFYKEATPFYKIFELLYNNGFYLYYWMPSTKHGLFQMLENDVFFLNSKFFKYIKE